MERHVLLWSLGMSEVFAITNYSFQKKSFSRSLNPETPKFVGDGGGGWVKPTPFITF